MLAIALGDPTGIGPEVALKAVAAELPRDDERYLLIGDEVLVRDLNARLKLGLAISNSPDDASCVLIGAPVSAPARAIDFSKLAVLEAGAPSAARAALAWLKHGDRKSVV